jgi:DNA-binding NarL/FixJ family response regulator
MLEKVQPMPSPIRVLVVEDFEPFRRVLRSALQERSELQLVGEVCDGLEAVQAARVMQPDLILMDIGLPAMNGIEAAKHIKAESPALKILFVSENRHPEVVQEALSKDAGGYVLKSDVARELVAAMQAVLEGRQFISSSLCELLN